MIRAAFFREGDRLVGFECQGHSGYAESGSDIVCAAVSALLIGTSNAVEGLVGVKPHVIQRDHAGYLKVTIPGPLTPDQARDCQLLIEAARLNIEDISKQYPDNVRVITKDRRSST